MSGPVVPPAPPAADGTTSWFGRAAHPTPNGQDSLFAALIGIGEQLAGVLDPRRALQGRTAVAEEPAMARVAGSDRIPTTQNDLSVCDPKAALAPEQDGHLQLQEKPTPAPDVDSGVQPEAAPKCVNPGNPVFSCMLDPKSLQTATSLSKPQMIMYKTDSGHYGSCTPSPHFLPCLYQPQQQVFSQRLKITGFYQNNSLNTAPNRTRTVDFPNLQHTM